MKKSFHFDTILKLCSEAGVPSPDAFWISYSSQFVDDNTEVYELNGFVNEISQTLNILKPQKEYERIYKTFHYWPSGSYEQCMDVRYFGVNPNRVIAGVACGKLFDKAVSDKNPFLMGIYLHQLADTFSHQNFSGIWEPWNALDGISSALTPNIGHADAGHDPDIENKIWRDSRLLVDTNNTEVFKKAENACYDAIKAYSKHTSKKEYPRMVYDKGFIMTDLRFWKLFQNAVKWTLATTDSWISF